MKFKYFEKIKNKEKYYKFFQNLFQISILVFCFIYVYFNFNNISANIVKINFNSIYIYYSFLFSLLGVFLGGVVWFLLIRTKSKDFNFITSSEIHFSSNMAKYVPGFIWQIVGKIFLTYKYINDRNTISKLVVKEFYFIILTGLHLITIIYFFYSGLFLDITEDHKNLLFLTLLIVNIIFLIVFWFIFVKDKGFNLPEAITIIKIIFIIVIAWIINGYSLHFLILSFGIKVDFLSTLFYLCSSYLIGFIIFFIPGSFGVREGVLIFFFQPLLGKDLALTISILIRLLIIISEFFWFLSLKVVRKQ